MRKIFFVPSTQDTFDKLDSPSPSSKNMPDWYKNANKFIGGKLDVGPHGVNKDLKLCSPFFDAMTAGYQIELSCDLVVNKDENNNKQFYFLEGQDVVGFRDIMGARTMPRAHEHDDQLYVWKMPWGFRTPPGYSMLITHPLNRFDLPFVTTSGIMDTDEYSLGGDVPFFLQKDFSGVIPAGTPILQAIPFKREAWVSETEKYNDAFAKKQLHTIRKTIYGAYTKTMWHKKSYK